MTKQKNNIVVRIDGVINLAVFNIAVIFKQFVNTVANNLIMLFDIALLHERHIKPTLIIIVIVNLGPI